MYPEYPHHRDENMRVLWYTVFCKYWIYLKHLFIQKLTGN